MMPEKEERKDPAGDEQNSHPNAGKADCGYYAGALCPKCRQGILDYNGLLNLQCPVCGLENGYGFT